MILSYDQHKPLIGESCFIAHDAHVIGAVELQDYVTILFGSSVRGDILPIKIGRRSNLQEQVIVHTSKGRTPSIIGDEVTVGHRALIHGAHVGNRVIVGMGAILLDEAVIEDECIIGAGSVVTERKRFPARSLIFGSPAKVVRSLDEEEIKFLSESASRYVEVGRKYSAMRIDVRDE